MRTLSINTGARQFPVSFTLFVDAKNSRGVTIEVSGEWCRWLARSRSTLLGDPGFLETKASMLRAFGAAPAAKNPYTAAKLRVSTSRHLGR